MLCSDGLVEGLWNRGMQRLIRNPPSEAEGNAAERLVKEAVATDGRDNTTAVVFELIPLQERASE
jgi:protein phosphatase